MPTLAPYADELRAFHSAMAAAIAGIRNRVVAGYAEQRAQRSRRQVPICARQAAARFPLHPARRGGYRAIRAAAAKLPFVQSGAAHVRITGPVALADTQFAHSRRRDRYRAHRQVALITLWLFLAVGSWRLIVPILADTWFGADADVALRGSGDRHAQPGLGGVRCAVRGHCRGLQSSVHRSLPRGQIRHPATGRKRCG